MPDNCNERKRNKLQCANGVPNGIDLTPLFFALFLRQASP
jgi:hypothetical protein